MTMLTPGEQATLWLHDKVRTDVDHGHHSNGRNKQTRMSATYRLKSSFVLELSYSLPALHWARWNNALDDSDAQGSVWNGWWSSAGSYFRACPGSSLLAAAQSNGRFFFSLGSIWMLNSIAHKSSLHLFEHNDEINHREVYIHRQTCTRETVRRVWYHIKLPP